MVKKMSSLFKYFGCENKEELYNKVKADDKSVRSLVDFIDYSKSSIKNPNKPITSPDSFAELISGLQKPSKGEALLVFVNTKNLPEHFSRIDVNDEEARKDALKESLVAGSQSLFVMYDEDVSSYNRRNLEQYFEGVSINVTDTFDHNAEEGYIRSKRQETPTPYDPMQKSVAEVNKEKSYTYEDREMRHFEGYDEFTSFFAEQEILGLDFIDDNNHIKENVKVGFQDDWQETFGIMACDSDGYVISVKELFKGTTNSAMIDMKVVAKELLTTDDINGLVVFHNHPSGDPINIVS